MAKPASPCVSSPRIVYSRSALLACRPPVHLHGSDACPLGRKVRRRLWHFGILRRNYFGALPNIAIATSDHPPASATVISSPNSLQETYEAASFAIPVRVTYRRPQPLSINPADTSADDQELSWRVRHKRNTQKPHNDRQKVLINIKRHTKKKCRTRVIRHPSIVLTNARSLRNKFDEFSLRLRSIKPGIAIVCETWLDDTTDTSWLNIPNYQQIRKDRGSPGGGILVYCSDNHDIRSCDCIPAINTSHKALKSEFLTFIIDSNVLVIALYHPYWGSSPLHDAVIDILIDIVAHGRNHHSVSSVLICGDFNGLAARVPQINALLGTSSLFDFHTRCGAQLDFVLTDCKEAYSDACVLPPLARSDHNVVHCKASNKYPRPRVTKIQYRKKLPASCARFREALTATSSFLESVMFECDTDEAACVLTDGLSELYNSVFPLKTLRLRNDDKAWVKPSLKLLINARDRAYAERKHLKYLRLRDTVIAHIRDLKRNFLNSVPCNNSNSNSRKWKAVNELIHHKKKPTQVNVNDMLEVFSQTFVPSDIDGILEQLDTMPYNAPLSVTQNEVFDILIHLKKGSPGPDEVPFWVLRDFADILAPSIQHVINLSLATGVMPTCWRRANVVPIPKVSQPKLTDYRPISLLPILSKVIEKLVLKKWLYQSVSPIGPTQFAFVPRTGQGTVTALTYTIHRILSHLDTPGAVRLLMLDYSKAFDRIPHQVILQSLIDKNAPKELLLWIASYLSVREQRIKCNGNYSLWFRATSGVPQGGVLAPLLFASAMDSLEPKFGNSTLVKFADDISVLHCIREVEDDKLSEELNHILTWSHEHGMHLNYMKTKVMNFNTKKALNLSALCDPESSTIIEEVSSAKLLGIVLDNKLNWQQHLDHTLSKARRRIYLLHCLKQISPNNHQLLRTVYVTMIRSILTYAYPAWCNITASRFRHIASLEKRLCKLFGFSCSEDITSFCLRTAEQLALKAEDEEHPLHLIHDSEETRHSERLGSRNRKLRSRTMRFQNSFIRFA